MQPDGVGGSVSCAEWREERADEEVVQRMKRADAAGYNDTLLERPSVSGRVVK